MPRDGKDERKELCQAFGDDDEEDGGGVSSVTGIGRSIPSKSTGGSDLAMTESERRRRRRPSRRYAKMSDDADGFLLAKAGQIIRAG